MGESRQKEDAMGLDDKINNKAEEVSGKTKEWVGDATDNERLEAEGKAQQTEAKVKQLIEEAKDKARDALS
jgi:uncharacterized protein YjbJ (UPF0337 family)